MAYKQIIIDGKYGRDRLEITVGRRNLVIRAVVDGCGSTFTVDKKELER